MMPPDRRRRDSACWLALVVVVACLAPSRSAVAAPSNKAIAREAYREGQRLVEANDYRRALAAFKRGYLAFEDPVFLFNIGQCHRLLEERSDAIRYYRAFLQRAPEAPNRVEVENLIAQLEGEAEAAQRPTQRTPQGDEPPPRPVDGSSGEVTPVYKKWWLWTIVGVVIVGAGLGVGLGLGLRGPPPFNPTLPDFGPAAAKPSSAVFQVRF